MQTAPSVPQNRINNIDMIPVYTSLLTETQSIAILCIIVKTRNATFFPKERCLKVGPTKIYEKYIMTRNQLSLSWFLIPVIFISPHYYVLSYLLHNYIN